MVLRPSKVIMQKPFKFPGDFESVTSHFASTVAEVALVLYNP